MDTPNYRIVIPARYNSSRFPGKPLHLLNGKAMILHVVERAQESSATDVVVATDDQRIQAVCEAEGVHTEMTKVEHASGTDRIAEVAARLNWPGDDIVVGLQGDEPATPAHHLDLLAANLFSYPHADMATLCTAITDQKDYQNPHRVKVVRSASNMALYFSRASIPARRDALADASYPKSYLHIGLYAYRCNFLQRYIEMDNCLLETEEQLEQLRVLYHGGSIHVGEIEQAPAHGVDQIEDVTAVEQALKAHRSS